MSIMDIRDMNVGAMRIPADITGFWFHPIVVTKWFPLVVTSIFAGAVLLPFGNRPFPSCAYAVRRSYKMSRLLSCQAQYNFAYGSAELIHSSEILRLGEEEYGLNGNKAYIVEGSLPSLRSQLELGLAKLPKMPKCYHPSNYPQCPARRTGPARICWLQNHQATARLSTK